MVKRFAFTVLTYLSRIENFDMSFASSDSTRLSKTLLTPDASDEEARAAAQLICPVTVQAFTAPIHLLALDLYNRESVVGGISRAALSAVL